MANSSIAVELRESRGKSAARKIRASGRAPAVVYGQGKDPVALSFDPAALERSIKSSHAGINTLFELEGESSVAGRTVMVKDMQREPVFGAILHVDLYEFDPHARIRVSVPVHVRGIAEGVTMGGLLEHSLREVDLDCLASSIPDELIVDVTELVLGSAIHVSDLELPAGVELLSDGDLAVVSIVAPKAEEEEAVEEEGEEAVEGEEKPAADSETEEASKDA